jgi:hypothetical protein
VKRSLNITLLQRSLINITTSSDIFPFQVVEMFSSNPSKSLAGTWGNEIKQKSFADKPPGKGLTITRESYNTINIMKEKEHIKNKFVKFVSDITGDIVMIMLCYVDHHYN